MFTPQQIDQISFGRSTFGGYDMQQVDEFLEPLTEDYVTLYKENALLKSKMRVLVSKLEEYRKNEASMKEAVLTAQRTCDKMVRDAEAKSAQILSSANASAAAAAAAAAAAPVAPAAPAQPSVNSEALIAAENARVDEARKVAVSRISEIQDQMRTCVQALERIKEANSAPSAPIAPAAPAAPVAPVAPAAAAAEASEPQSVAEVIAQNVEALVGTAEESAPKAAPRHPSHESTTSKFASLNLQFGRNYENGKK